jgi:hypothetical protein
LPGNAAQLRHLQRGQALPEVIKDRVRAGNLTQESAINLERIGVALAMRELKNCIADDDYALLLKKYYALTGWMCSSSP